MTVTAVLLVEGESVVADALDHVLRPGLDVACRAALEQDQESVAAKTSAQVIGASCTRSTSANCPMKSSLASAPIAFWISANRRA